MNTEYLADSGTELKLQRAILIYENTNAYSGNAPTAVATVHPIAEGVIAPGQAVTRESLEALSRALLEQEVRGPQPKAAARVEFSPLIPATLVALSATSMLWVCPSAVRPIHFRTENAKLQKLSGQPVRHPHLLFRRSTDGLSVFALATGARPTEQTRLYQAPYHNLWKGGKMCMGDAPLPRAIHPALIPQIERAFFQSEFTHSNINGEALTKHRSGHLGLWQAMRRARRFPSHLLVPVKNRLKELL